MDDIQGLETKILLQPLFGYQKEGERNLSFFCTWTKLTKW